MKSQCCPLQPDAASSAALLKESEVPQLGSALVGEGWAELGWLVHL